jgi:hypothetical protein
MWPHPRASILVHYDVRPVQVPIDRQRSASMSHAFVVASSDGAFKLTYALTGTLQTPTEKGEPLGLTLSCCR